MGGKTLDIIKCKASILIVRPLLVRSMGIPEGGVVSIGIRNVLSIGNWFVDTFHDFQVWEFIPLLFHKFVDMGN